MEMRLSDGALLAHTSGGKKQGPLFTEIQQTGETTSFSSNLYDIKYIFGGKTVLDNDVVSALSVFI